ncbi:unnamed protein product, partial [Urochloa humidicola]
KNRIDPIESVCYQCRRTQKILLLSHAIHSLKCLKKNHSLKNANQYPTWLQPPTSPSPRSITHSAPLVVDLITNHSIAMPPHATKEPATAPTPPPRRTLEDALAAARPFLRGEEAEVDPALPGLIAVLRAADAGECWHKHGTFLAHLLDVHRILHLWGAPAAVSRCGLFHSAYSNSYVNLAIFQPDTGRAHVAAVVGAPAERLVHLFCVVPRQQLIHDDLLFHYSDDDLVADLARSEASLQNARQGVFNASSQPQASPSSTSEQGMMWHCPGASRPRSSS